MGAVSGQLRVREGGERAGDVRVGAPLQGFSADPRVVVVVDGLVEPSLGFQQAGEVSVARRDVGVQGVARVGAGDVVDGLLEHGERGVGLAVSLEVHGHAPREGATQAGGEVAAIEAGTDPGGPRIVRRGWV